jgi:putative Mn2+ efflux pump MntP
VFTDLLLALLPLDPLRLDVAELSPLRLALVGTAISVDLAPCSFLVVLLHLACSLLLAVIAIAVALVWLLLLGLVVGRVVSSVVEQIVEVHLAFGAG